MFEKGEMVVYGNTGVCRVDDVGRLENMQEADRDKLYYTLTPLYSYGVIYTPVDTKIYMRPVLTREAADELICKIPQIPEDACETKDQRVLSDHYKASFESHQCEDLLQLIKTIYEKNRKNAHNGKKPGQIDQRYMKRAEELLYGELSVALGIPCEEVPPYIRQKLSSLEQASS